MTDATTEREATVRYLERRMQPTLARAIARGVHLRPQPKPRVCQGTNHQWPCGHERTEINTVRVGRNNGVRCAECRRAIGAAYRKRVRAARD